MAPSLTLVAIAPDVHGQTARAQGRCQFLHPLSGAHVCHRNSIKSDNLIIQAQLAELCWTAWGRTDGQRDRCRGNGLGHQAKATAAVCRGQLVTRSQAVGRHFSHVIKYSWLHSMEALATSSRGASITSRFWNLRLQICKWILASIPNKKVH